MADPHEIYRYRDGVRADDVRASVMLVALGGFVDAGHTQQLLSAHLLAHHEHEPIATFDVDQLIDYRSRRPMMTFERDRYTDYAAPKIELHRVSDLDGTPFLLLTGIEPDYQWERVVAAVTSLIDELGVSLTVMVHGIPMGVPHTRPFGATAHASDPSLIGHEVSPFEKVMVPGSVEGLLELRLAEAGKDVVGYSVHIPHYLAQLPLPGASLEALNRLTVLTGLRLQRGGLEAAAAQGMAKLASEIEGREDVAQMVSALEQQYDEYQAARGVQPRGLPAGDLPSADEIGAEAEEFLRGLGES